MEQLNKPHHWGYYAIIRMVHEQVQDRGSVRNDAKVWEYCNDLEVV